MDIGKKIKQLRKSKNISQSILAHASGITVNTIRLIENGYVEKPRKETLDALTDALDKLSPRERMGRSYQDSPEVRALLRKLKGEADTDSLSLPWRARIRPADPFTVGVEYVVVAASGKIVAQDLSEADAHLIVECVNMVLS